MVQQRNAYSHLKATTPANVPKEYWPGGNEKSFPEQYHSEVAELFENGFVHRTLTEKTLERKAMQDKKEREEQLIV